MTARAGGEQRPLTERQAHACEVGDSARCRCRCGGALHGAYRVDNVRALPVNDPHFPARQMTLEDSSLEEREWRRRE